MGIILCQWLLMFWPICQVLCWNEFCNSSPNVQQWMLVTGKSESSKKTNHIMLISNSYNYERRLTPWTLFFIIVIIFENIKPHTVRSLLIPYLVPCVWMILIPYSTVETLQSVLMWCSSFCNVSKSALATTDDIPKLSRTRIATLWTIIEASFYIIHIYFSTVSFLTQYIVQKNFIQTCIDCFMFFIITILVRCYCFCFFSMCKCSLVQIFVSYVEFCIHQLYASHFIDMKNTNFLQHFQISDFSLSCW